MSLPTTHCPYPDEATNIVYNLLFCDNPGLYTAEMKQPYTHPYDILFSDTSTVADLQNIIDDKNVDPRIAMLAYNKQVAKGHTPATKELLGVIVEIGLDEGLDTLASFSNGTARYINHTGKMLIWENTDDVTVKSIIADLFDHSEDILEKIGPWDQPRKAYPSTGNLRLTFLVSDGLYFGEGPMDIMFNEPMAAPALNAATQLLQYLTSASAENRS